jgi:hypothetical protein
MTAAVLKFVFLATSGGRVRISGISIFSESLLRSGDSEPGHVSAPGLHLKKKEDVQI